MGRRGGAGAIAWVFGGALGLDVLVRIFFLVRMDTYRNNELRGSHFVA